MRESFFPSAGGVTTMPTSNLLSMSDWRLRAFLPVFVFFLPCLMLDLLFGHVGGACSPRVQPSGAHTDVHKGARVDALKERAEVIKTACSAWKQPNPVCLSVCLAWEES